MSVAKKKIQPNDSFRKEGIDSTRDEKENINHVREILFGKEVRGIDNKIKDINLNLNNAVDKINLSLVSEVEKLKASMKTQEKLWKREVFELQSKHDKSQESSTDSIKAIEKTFHSRLNKVIAETAMRDELSELFSNASLLIKKRKMKKEL